MTACPFITVGHPFEPAMAGIRGALEAATVSGPVDAKRSARQNELKGTRDANGGWQLDRFYASSHAWTTSGGAPFHAATYHYSGATESGQWFRFPNDPYLGALEHLNGARAAEVLQYVVLRRLTYRATTEDGASYIGKFKRRSRARGAYDVLSLVTDAARDAKLSFRVPAPLHFDSSRNMFLQEAVPGRPVSELVNEDTMESLLFGVGRVHAELHRLDVPRLPIADDRAQVDTLSRNCDWIGFFRPSEGLRLGRVRDLLLQIAGGFDKTTLVTCHGDFVPSHVLYGAEGWAVVDFDLTHRGDAHADGALLLASLTQDVPMLRRIWRDPNGEPFGLLNRAVAAYVDGYQSFGGAVLDRRRLLWHRIAAEVHMLGLMFTKDRFDTLAFERSMGRIEGLATDLAAPRGGAA